MRIESSVTSVSWIPLGAVEGMDQLAFELKLAHYDLPPPDRLGDVGALVADGAVRFANELRAWVEVEDGRTPARPPSPLRADSGADRLVDARAHHPRRRVVGARGRGRKLVPAPLGLRPRR